MRPDSRLYGLAGITAQAGTVTDGYLAVNAASEPGAGITTDTMQFHGTANRYALNGATTVATLYSTATPAPACPRSRSAASAPTAARSPPSPSTSPAR